MRFLVFSMSLFLILSCTRHKTLQDGSRDLPTLLDTTKSIGDAKLDSSQIKQKLILVNFWASWCGPCMAETPALLKFVTNKKNDLFLISVSEDDSRKDMQKFLQLFPTAQSSNVFLIHDLDRKWSQNFSVFKFPETFVFNNKMKLLKHIEGSMPYETPQVQDMILSLKAKNSN